LEGEIYKISENSVAKKKITFTVDDTLRKKYGVQPLHFGGRTTTLRQKVYRQQRCATAAFWW
jgi:hypothetical protein